MMRNIFTSLALAATALTACSPSAGFDQTGYFKDDQRNRVFAYTAPVDADADTVRGHASNQMHTAGQVTGVYYWAPGTVGLGPQLTRATDFFVTLDLLEAPGISSWRFAAIHSPNGEFSFADCAAQPGDSLCRQAADGS